MYVCIKMLTYNSSARFHSLTEMSPDRNGPVRSGRDRKPQTERARPKSRVPQRNNLLPQIS